MSILGVEAVSLANKTLFSGIQPTGVFHIGNLLGAIKSWQNLAETAPSSATIRFMVADLHAITVAREATTLRQDRTQALASIIAAGIDPKRCDIYFQSKVPAHAELHWLLSSISSMGYLSRMVQWKSKASIANNATLDALNAAQLSDLNLGLFSYPTLQAADILINQSHYVPVGDDQSQHLELTRHLAQTFNYRFGNTFVVPKTVLTPTKKILSLRNGSKKMSKSDPDKGSCIYMTDTADEINAKVKRAVTDSIQGPVTFDMTARPEVSNLVQIAAGFDNITPEKWIAEKNPENHKMLKEAVAASIIQAIVPMGQEFSKLMNDKAYLTEIAKRGTSSASEAAAGVIQLCKEKMGFE